MPNNFEYLLTDQEVTNYTEAGYWKNRLLTDYLDDAVKAHPDQVCTVDPAGEHTYAELAADVETTAHALLASGVEPTDVVSIHLPNWYEWLVIHLAAIRIGAITNPLIPIYRDREIGYMAEAANTSLLFITEEFRKFNYVDMVNRLRPNLPNIKEVIVVRGSQEHEGFTSWDTFQESGKQHRNENQMDFEAIKPDANSLVLINFTSGTTGRPKGVMHIHNSVLHGGLPWPDKLGMDHTSVIHMASTFAHLTGYLYGVELPIILGAKGVFQDVWNPEEFIELVENHKINHTSGASPFLHDLISARNLAEHDVTSLKRFCCMGAPIPRAYVTTAKEKLPNMSVFGGWGQTECGLSTMCSPTDTFEKIVNTDGSPLPGMAIRTLDWEGKETAPGVEGKLQVKGPILFRGYVNQLDVTRNEMDGEWFDTGDIATIDEDGYVRLSGRSKDIIIRGGENIPVADVENVLYEHPEIEATAVVGVPHERLQEVAAAVVVLKEGAPELTMESLRAYLETKGLAKPYWPEQLVIVPELPRTPSGKIQKFLIRKELVEKASAEGTK